MSSLHFCQQCSRILLFLSKECQHARARSKEKSEPEEMLSDLPAKIKVFCHVPIEILWADLLPLLSAGCCKYWIYSQVSAMGSCDAGICNAGTCDAGICNAGTCDAGICDAGTCDAGTCGAGTCDAGTCGAGTCDAGTCGAGTCDAGTCGLDLLPFTCAAFKFDTFHTFPW